MILFGKIIKRSIFQKTIYLQWEFFMLKHIIDNSDDKNI